MRKVILWVGFEEYWLILETLGVSGVCFPRRWDGCTGMSPRNFNHVMWEYT